MSRDPGLNTYTDVAALADDIVAAPAPWDSLSHPSNDDMLGAALTMWPPGAAFGTADGEALSLASTIARLTRSILAPFEALYDRAYRLAMESSVFGVDALLAEWEAEYGLPDNCVSGSTTVSERLRALEARVASAAVITPGDFIRLAASYGFEIAIEEPAIFEVGFSECGGQHVIGSPREEVYWIVYVALLAIDYFRASESECGYDPLFSIGDAERLMCILRKVSPAWTIPVLSSDALRPAFDPPPGAEWVFFEEAFPRRYITLDGEYVYTIITP
jgi:uncharacterized protein YmfQ (DUF2313 family)